MKREESPIRPAPEGPSARRPRRFGKDALRRLRLPALLLLGAAWIFWFIRSSSHIRVTTIRLENTAFAEILAGKTVLQLSDPHFSAADGRRLVEILRLIRSLHPDLICATGDYVNWQSGQADYARAFDFLRELSAPLGVYAILGDADYTLARASCLYCHEQGDSRPLDLPGVRMLRDASIELRVDGHILRIAGLDGRRPVAPPQRLLDSLTAGTPTLLLSHFSLGYRELPADRDVLMLSGDTHGGQFKLPAFVWRWTLRKPDPEHIYGLFREGRKSLYVSSGLGTSTLHFRAGVRPELVLFKFVPEGKTSAREITE